MWQLTLLGGFGLSNALVSVAKRNIARVLVNYIGNAFFLSPPSLVLHILHDNLGIQALREFLFWRNIWIRDNL